MAASGRTVQEPTVRSYKQEAQTSGTLAAPVSKPMPRSSSQRITPPAASSPKALPPLSTTAWIRSAAATGFSNSDSREAGPPPRTSSPAAAPSGHRTTVHPVAASRFSA